MSTGSSTNIDEPEAGTSDPAKGFARKLLLGLALVTVLTLWLFRDPIRSWITEKAVLANDAPDIGVVEDIILESTNPEAALLAVWTSGKLVHRQVAIRMLPHLKPRTQSISGPLETMLLSAALAPDLTVREAALSILRSRDHSAHRALAAAQLRDPDPEVRLLGLDHLRTSPDNIGIPLVIPLLDDSDLRIQAMTLKWLEAWSGEQFGVKMVDSAQTENQETGRKEFRAEGRDKILAGVTRARAWWAQHQSRFKPAHLEIPTPALAELKPMAAPKFRASTLDNRAVRLSDYRGKVVLVNFWTTWCTPCIGEIPELVDLQNRRGKEIVILGISLDGVQDSHGHIGGHAAGDDDHDDDHDHDHDDHNHAPSVEQIERLVNRTVKRRGINYSVIVDEKGTVGAKFNGGELPTTVIIDREGRIRRRFVGPRTTAVFEAMIAEASKPWSKPPSFVGSTPEREKTQPSP